jgi:hypothetical protein
MYKKCSLNHENSYRYIAEQLQIGLTLSEHLLSMLSIEKGKIWTYVPDGTPQEDAIHLETAYVNNLSGTSEFVYEYLTQPYSTAVIEDINARAYDSSAKHFEEDYFIHNNFIFYFLTQSKRSKDYIEQVMQAPFPYPFVCALSQFASATPIPADREIVSESIFDNIVRHTTHIIVGAYDGVGYVIWEKQ